MVEFQGRPLNSPLHAVMNGGFIGTGLLVTHILVPDGVSERGAVYAFMLWQFLAGIALWRSPIPAAEPDIDSLTPMTAPDLAVSTAAERDSLISFVEAQRLEIERLADDLSEAEARSRLVPSLTTVLGLLKHATFVEQVWFETRLAGRTRAETGLPETVDESFAITETDTLASALAEFRAACARSRQILEPLELDATVTARTGEVSVRWILLHLIREYARHAGHADILREQLLARRRAPSPSRP